MNGQEWLPDNIAWILDDDQLSGSGIPWMEIEGDSEQAGQMRELQGIGKAGFCMTCGNRLGEDTVILFGNGGISATYDKGVCLTDQLLMGWLQGQLDDTIQAIQMRQMAEGGRESGDTPDDPSAEGQ